MIALLAQAVEAGDTANDATSSPLWWWAIAAVGMMGSALYSGSETGVYRLNRVRLHLLVHRGDGNAKVLESLVNRPNRLLGALLVGNNVANYLSSLGISALLTIRFGDNEWLIIGVTAVLLTPLLFVFGEVLPKDLFRGYTDVLTYRLARFLWVTQKLVLISGVGPLIDGVSWTLRKVLGANELSMSTLHPRRVVNELMKEGIVRGLISPYQSDMIDRVLHPTELDVADAMVPWDQVQTVRADAPPEAVWSIADRSSYSRVPIVSAGGEVAGVLYVLDVLIRPADGCPPLVELSRGVSRVSPDVPVRNVLRQMRREQTAMAVVAGESGKPLGIVTVKDLVEPVTGDLTAW